MNFGTTNKITLQRDRSLKRALRKYGKQIFFDKGKGNEEG